MLAEEDVESSNIIIGSDNCSSQCKSTLHFQHLQVITKMYNKNIIRMYSIPCHSKGEVDHVGGTVKVAA